MLSFSHPVNARLEPPWSHPRRVGLRALRATLERAIREHLLPRASQPGERALVDLGCGSAPYRPLFEPYVTRYLGADLALNPTAEVTLDPATGRVDFPAGGAAVVLSTQVLEHVEAPAAYLAEALRLCHAEGLLLLSTHGFWLHHPDPQDYWRWTGQGLRKLLTDGGWEVVGWYGILGFLSASLCLVQDALCLRLPRLLHPLVTIPLQALVGISAGRETDGGRAENAALYLVVARPARRG